MNIILASASPRRCELLKRIYSEFEVIPSSAEETVPESVKWDYHAEFLAVRKALQVAENHRDSLVIGCDTVVVDNGRVLGKPVDEDDAYNMLKNLSGKTHSVITGVCFCYMGKSFSFSSETLVSFYELSDDEIRKYIAGREPMDKAGAYGIQGDGGLFVKEIKGDFYNVVGLPVAELNRRIKQFIGG